MFLQEHFEDDCLIYGMVDCEFDKVFLQEHCGKLIGVTRGCFICEYGFPLLNDYKPASWQDFQIIKRQMSFASHFLLS